MVWHVKKSKAVTDLLCLNIESLIALDFMLETHVIEQDYNDDYNDDDDVVLIMGSVAYSVYPLSTERQRLGAPSSFHTTQQCSSTHTDNLPLWLKNNYSLPYSTAHTHSSNRKTALQKITSFCHYYILTPRIRYSYYYSCSSVTEKTG